MQGQRAVERRSTGPWAPWLVLAIGSLLLSGVFALLLMVGRVPPFSGWVSDPELFKRCLVVHVDLSIVVWFHAFTAALFALLPARSSFGAAQRIGFGLSAGGVALVLSCIFLKDARPILSNYVPSLDHPVFLLGILAFFAGVAVSFLDGRLLPSGELPGAPTDVPSEARPGLRAAALAFLFAVLTLLATAVSLPPGLLPQTRYEFLFWGAGHVLQVASVCAMLCVWLILLAPLLAEPVLSRRASAALFGLLVAPPALAPLLALGGMDKTWVHVGFTRLMQFGIFPAVLVFAALCLRAVVGAVRLGRLRALDGRLLPFYASLALTLAGFALGALIRGSTTTIPAHYHASIGAVTVSFMAVSYRLFARWGVAEPSGRWGALRSLQPVVFGAGQLVFALGFALAGAQGMARKAYGAEQHIRTPLETAGLVVMGLGGLVAVAGGLAFLAFAVKAFAASRRLSPLRLSADPRSSPWPDPTANTSSKP